MTATKSVANNTETMEDQTPVVDVDVVSSDTTPEPTAPAKDKAINPKDVVETAKSVIDWARQREAVDNLKASTGQALEDNNHYSELGCFYAAQAPVANSMGAEIGVVTKDEKTNKVQRTGIGIYVRSDHAANYTFDLPSK
jgi:hypothetical protein